MTPDVVVRTREALKAVMARHEWPNPHVRQRATEGLLALVATVRYHGDDDAYVLEAWTLACAMMNSIVEQHRADAALRRLKTTKSIH
jgi:hypothetical protein